MQHRMQLNKDPFERMIKGLKDLEVRLYDEKRQRLSVGDTIIFNLRNTDKTIHTEVVDLMIHKEFKDLTSKNMYEYYSKEDEEKYGVVGIKIKLIQT